MQRAQIRAKDLSKEMQIRNCAKRRELRRQCAGSTLISTPIPPELLSRFEPVAREQLKQVVANRVSQFFTVDSFKVEGKDPLVVRFLGEKITYVGRTETERKPYQYRVSLRDVERTQQNPYGLVVSSVEQAEASTESPPSKKSER